MQKIAGITLAALAAAAALIAPPAPAADAGQFEVVETIDVPANPFGATIAPDGETVWVANSGEVTANARTVTVIDTQTFAIESVIEVGNFPEDIAFASGGHALVTNSSDATVSVIDTAARATTQTVSLAPIPMEFPFGIITDASGTKAYVSSVGGQRDTSDDNVAVLDLTNTADVRISTAIETLGFLGRPALDPDGGRFFVGRSLGDFGPPEILVVDTATDTVVDGIFRGPEVGTVHDLAVTPDGRFIYAGVFGGEGGVWVVDADTLTTVTIIPTGDTRVHGIGMSPDGSFVFATNFQLGSVSVISTATNEIVATVPVGSLPNEVAVTLDSTHAFVTNQGNTTVSVISIPGS